MWPATITCASCLRWRFRGQNASVAHPRDAVGENAQKVATARDDMTAYTVYRAVDLRSRDHRYCCRARRYERRGQDEIKHEAREVHGRRLRSVNASLAAILETTSPQTIERRPRRHCTLYLSRGIGDPAAACRPTRREMRHSTTAVGTSDSSHPRETWSFAYACSSAHAREMPGYE